MTVISEPVSPRDAARQWISDAITKHLHAELGGAERIRNVAAAFEDEAQSQNMSIELAVSLAVEWCDEQNAEAGLVNFSK